MSPKKHYLNNKEFEGVISKYLEDPSKDHENDLVEKLDILITNILLSFKFKVDFDDAKQECFMLAFKTLKNFKGSKGSAFNYFTTVIVNNLKLMYTKNKKYMQKIHDYQEIVNSSTPWKGRA